jgi:GTP-binding protein LepA
MPRSTTSFKEFRAADVVKLDVLINGDKVDALSVIVHRANAQFTAAANWPSQDARADPAPDVRRGDPGGDRLDIIARETSRPCARTCWPSATAATSRARRSCWKSRRPARSA